MHTALGRYRVKLNRAEDALRLFERDLVPSLRQLAGFVSYHAAIAAPQLLLSVGIYRDKATTEQANRIIGDWVDTHATEIVEGPPKLVAGEIRISQSV
jgi:hypothetical protein